MGADVAKATCDKNELSVRPTLRISLTLGLELAGAIIFVNAERPPMHHQHCYINYRSVVVAMRSSPHSRSLRPLSGQDSRSLLKIPVRFLKIPVHDVCQSDEFPEIVPR